MIGALSGADPAGGGTECRYGETGKGDRPAPPERWPEKKNARPDKRSGVKNTGGQGRNRTTDTRIFSPLLYQLSYLAMRIIRCSWRISIGFIC